MVVWLFSGAIICSCDEDNSVDRNAAVNWPSEGAAVTKSPESGEEGDAEQRTGKAAEFAASGAAEFDGAIDGTGALKESLVLCHRDFPAEGACCGRQTAIGGDGKSLTSPKRAPDFNVRGGLLEMEKEALIPFG